MIKLFKKVDLKCWIILFLIIALALIIRLQSPVSHNMFIDEHIYTETAKNLLENFENNHDRLIGWPMILAFVFFFTGVDNIIAIYVGLFFGILIIPLLFFFFLTIFKNKYLSLFATFIFSLFPSFIKWGFSAETNISALFFLILAFWFSIIYLNNIHNKNLLWLSLISISFASHFRPENIFLIIIFFIGCFLYIKKIKSFFLTNKFIFFYFFLLTFFNYIKVFYFYLLIEKADFNLLIEHTSFNLLFLYPEYIFSQMNFFTIKFIFIILLIFSLIGIFYIYKFNDKKLLYLLLSWFIIYYIFIIAMSPGQILET
ncbi:MAG: hypothetical protein ACLFPJ_06010, partial [Candidatus Woesearchaeota archaeon]